MVNTLGNEIIGAFTNGVAVKEIYAYGELVWPIGQEWYVQWTPSDLTGTFSMFGQIYSLQDYSGNYSWIGGNQSGMITSRAFESCSIVTMETNVMSVQDSAFTGCYSLSEVSLPVCSCIGTYTFNDCTSLSLLILGSNSVVSIDSSYETFYNTPFANCEGSILVQPYLVDTYKSAPGWSSLSCIIGYIPSIYYIKWLPTNVSTGFNIDGVSYQTTDFSNGMFIWSSSVITENAFNVEYSGQENASYITYIETNVYSIGVGAFYECSGLQSVSLYSCEYIGSYAFLGCWSLTSIELPMCSYIGKAAFKENAELSQVSLPVCSYIGEDAFEMTPLKTIDLPMCSHLGVGAFWGCNDLSEVSLPVCESIGFKTFEACGHLTSIELPMCSYIGEEAFHYCGISKITLGGSSVCVLENRYIFSGTSITSSTGSILVPSSLVLAYKADSVWRYFKNRIFPIPN